MIAVILAGGMGTRLAEITKNLPKPLIEIQGKPILQYQIENLKRFGINKIFLVIGHQGYKIKSFFGKGTAFGVKINYYQEKTPLGTAGSFYYIKELLSENFLVIYGDLIFDLDFAKIIAFHEKKQALCSLVVHPNDHPHDSDIIIMDDKDIVTRVLKKNKPRKEYYKNTVNAGVALLNKESLKILQKSKKQDLEENVIFPLIQDKRVFGYKTSEYIKDIGTPDRYEKVKQHVFKGIVSKRNINFKQKAIFLDRDGTINKNVGFVTCCNDLEIMDEAYSALKIINESNYLAIVITNQSVIARNLCSITALNEIHCKMEVDFGKKSVYIDDLFYCPHHPNQGYPEENIAYKIECNCRKPKIGLIDLAVRKYNIDLTDSYFIGDSLIDVQTGKNALMKTILLGERSAFHIETQPDYYAKDLLEAVNIIVKMGDAK